MSEYIKNIINSMVEEIEDKILNVEYASTIYDVEDYIIEEFIGAIIENKEKIVYYDVEYDSYYVYDKDYVKKDTEVPILEFDGREYSLDDYDLDTDDLELDLEEVINSYCDVCSNDILYAVLSTLKKECESYLELFNLPKGMIWNQETYGRI